MAPDSAAIAEAESTAWIARARAGDRAAFGALVCAHQSRVRLQLRRLARGDDALADDLAQDTFVLAWRHLAGFRGDARFATWLHRIALTRFLQHVRRPGALEDWCEVVDAEPAHDPRLAEGLAYDVERALAELGEMQRLAILHCYHLDLSHAEAAQVLGLPLGTLKSHVGRAKARLRTRLAAWNPESTT